MALLRDAAVSLLHRAGVQPVAARLRTHGQHPERTVALVVGPIPTDAKALRRYSRHLDDGSLSGRSCRQGAQLG